MAQKWTEPLNIFFFEILKLNFKMTFYSDNLVDWYPAHEYQHNELQNAVLNFFPQHPNSLYESKTKDYLFKLAPIGNSKYIILRPNMTYGYLAWTGYKRVKAIHRVSEEKILLSQKGLLLCYGG